MVFSDISRVMHKTKIVI